MNAFKGTWRLTRLALRLDRIKLPVWIIAITGLMLISVPALESVYDTQEAKITYASATANGVAARVFGGAIDGPTLGAITMIEMYLFSAVLIAFMCTLTIVRHTRQNEETGRSELIGSTVIGRYSEISSAVIVASSANIVTSVLIYFILGTVDELSGAGALGLSITFALVGFSFMGVAAVASQVSDSSRGANSLSAIAIGLAFLIRGIGDGLATVGADGLSASPAWPTWLSPLGWGSLISPFTSQNWWIFSLYGGFLLVSFGSAGFLLRRRDIGMGIIPARKGRASAKQSLLSFSGLAIKLQRNIFIGWLSVSIILGVVFGSLAKEFSKLIAENAEFQQAFAAFGSDGDVTDVFFGAMYSFTALAIAGYCLQSLMRTKSEEGNNHLEALLSTAKGRLRWLGSHILPTILGLFVILLATGASAALTYIIISDAGFDQFVRLASATLVHAPAILILYTFGIFLYGVFPRFAAAGSWAVFVLSFMILQFAALLGLPVWVTNISPFSHASLLPSEAIDWTPIIVLSSVSLTLLIAGVIGFKKRDISTV
jgi:ABC-2 type transport system permease protein